MTIRAVGKVNAGSPHLALCQRLWELFSSDPNALQQVTAFATDKSSAASNKYLVFLVHAFAPLTAQCVPVTATNHAEAQGAVREAAEAYGPEILQVYSCRLDAYTIQR